MATLNDFLADPGSLNTTQALLAIATSVKAANDSIDAFFLCTMAIVVYFMQCGFACLEAGSIRSKNATNILLKITMEGFLGCLVYYLFGWALAFGEPGNPFCGNTNWAMSYLPDTRMHQWFFQFVFAITSTTIVSGALAERCEFIASIIYSFLITGFIYPIISHWVWSPVGWLAVGITAQNGSLVSKFHDFAGSGVVHVTGGFASLVGAALLGPRINRFHPETRKPMTLIPGHSVPLVSVGAFILFFGFLAFNGGSQGSIQNPGDGVKVAVAMVNTALSGSAAAVTALILGRIRSPHWSLLRTVNGGLAGCVAICAGCDVVYPWGACITGSIAACSYMAWSELVLAMKIDDPVDAVAVHFGGGSWGLLAVAFLHRDRGIVFRANQLSGLDLAVQIVGLLSIIAWSGGCSLIIFGVLRLLRMLRVAKEHELKGVDYPKHGEMAYPVPAYGHGWQDDATQVPEIAATELHPEVAIQYDVYRKANGFDLTRGVSNPVLNTSLTQM